jgi:hypothetical protein
MGIDLSLLPKKPVHFDPVNARDWLDREARRFAEIPNAIDPATQTRKRKLADLLLRMRPHFQEFDIRYEEIAQFEGIPIEKARRKYRYIEINGRASSSQSSISTLRFDSDELDAVLAALSVEGGFVLFDPQSDVVVDLSEASVA